MNIYETGIKDGMHYALDMADLIKMSQRFDSLNAPQSSGYSLGCAFSLMHWLYDLGVDAKTIKYLICIALHSTYEQKRFSDKS